MSGGGSGALLFGRWTYEKMAASGRTQPEDNLVRQVMTRATKYVVSRSRRSRSSGRTPSLLSGDAVETVAEPEGPRGRQHRDPRQRAS